MPTGGGSGRTGCAGAGYCFSAYEKKKMKRYILRGNNSQINLRREGSECRMSRETVSKWLKDMLPRKCMNCGAAGNLQYHHIVPVIYGGNEVPTNIAVLCSDCHSKVHYGRDGIINHGDSVRIGIERAKRERGLKVGRKPLEYEKIMRMIAENSTQFNSGSMTTEREIMDIAGVQPTSYAKCKRMLLSAMKEDVWPYEWDKPSVCKHRPEYDHVIRKMRGEVV